MPVALGVHDQIEGAARVIVIDIRSARAQLIDSTVRKGKRAIAVVDVDLKISLPAKCRAIIGITQIPIVLRRELLGGLGTASTDVEQSLRSRSQR